MLLLIASTTAPAGEDPSGREADQRALRAYAGLVGPWKGTGQPRRSSARGAWRESAEWVWALTPRSAALTMAVEGGKYVKSIALRPGRDAGRFVLDLVRPDGTEQRFVGRAGPREAAVFEPDGPTPTGAGIGRITLTPLHETRFLLLLEGRDGPEGPLVRLAEVGYTRQGVAFAAGDAYPVCIVTEGRGTIRVSHGGKEYWVCCTGCRELFEDDPEGIIAEFEARKRPSATEEKSP
jgi:hypothetical protein